MSSSKDDFAYDEYLNRIYENELKQKAIKKHKENLNSDNVYDYLINYSSEKKDKIQYCIKQSRVLYNNEFYSSATVNAVISIELIIRFFLVRPIFNGVFLYRKWSDMLLKKIIDAKQNKDRNILPALLRIWDIDVTEYKLESGNQFWESLLNVINSRNLYVHRTKIITKEEAKIALESFEKLVDITENVCQKVGYNFDLKI